MQAADTAAVVILQSLPAIGQPWLGIDGIYAGVITAADGAPYALVLLSDKPARDLPWRQAMDWAEGLGAALPTRPEAAMLFANTPQAFEKRWHWTSAQYSAHDAWSQAFVVGYQDISDKYYELRARAVRRFKLSPSAL